jgi:hypothetical protein
VEVHQAPQMEEVVVEVLVDTESFLLRPLLKELLIP